MTPEQLKARFPNASKSFIEANSRSEDSRKSAVVERSFGKTVEAQTGIEKTHSGKVRVRITDVRRRLIDVDNLVSKFHVDCCRYAGLLHSDAPDKTTIEVTQRKHRPGELPHTEIVIEQIL